jgi:hypothetical protein
MASQIHSKRGAINMYMKMGQNVPKKGIFYFNSVVRLTDLATIPFDSGNTDYKEYLVWLEEGNQPIDFDDAILNPEANNGL